MFSFLLLLLGCFDESVEQDNITKKAEVVEQNNITQEKEECKAVECKCDAVAVADPLSIEKAKILKKRGECKVKCDNIQSPSKAHMTIESSRKVCYKYCNFRHCVDCEDEWFIKGGRYYEVEIPL